MDATVTDARLLRTRAQLQLAHAALVKAQTPGQRKAIWVKIDRLLDEWLKISPVP